MKVAIMTQPLGANYGGIMQAWALQQVLKGAGHEPVTIDRRSDAKGLIDLVDMHICVLSYNSSSKKDIVEIINKLEGCDLSTIYFVLNRFSIFRTIYGLNLYYPGYKYSQYYNYYKS